MISWDRFEKWLRDHELPTTTVLRIEIVPTEGGEIHLQAKVLATDEDGNSPIYRKVAGGNDREWPETEILTETIVRRLVYLPDEQPEEGSVCA